jgi:hypothetical protein
MTCNFWLKHSQLESKPNTEYINRFIKMKCAADLLRLRMFPDAKEVTESLGMISACKLLPEEYHDKNRLDINVVVVGDGHRPRTGALFAFLTRWNCVSIDPELVETIWPIHRLKCFKNKVEDVKLHFDGPLLIVLPHSHAKASICLKNLTSTHGVCVINMPCCVPSDILNYEHTSFKDGRIWSPKNRVDFHTFGILS